jgi:RNA polymerase sigma-70 factor (ECF subfamily)
LLEWETLSESLEKALAAMPPAYREAVWLRDVEDQSYAEIAWITKTTTGTVRSRIHRGRTLLRQLIKGHLSEK